MINNILNSETECSLSSKKYIVNSNFILREIANEAVLIPVGDAGIFDNSMISLNDTCSFLWKQFQTPSTIDEVIRRAESEYEDTDDLMKQQIIEFIKESIQIGMIKEE